MNELLALFTRSSKLARAAADEAMSRHGVRVGQNLLLEVLWETDGLTPGELAARCTWPRRPWSSRPTGWPPRACCCASPTRRMPAWSGCTLPTGPGPCARPSNGSAEELERRMTATLIPAEREHLRSALIKIIAQLSDPPGPAGGSGERAAEGV